jgi:hypothetical protein
MLYLSAALLALPRQRARSPRVSLALNTTARVRRKQVGFVGLALPIFGIWRRVTFLDDVGPNLGIFGIDLEPLFQPRLSVRLDRVNWALRFANTAIDAFLRVDNEHVLTLVEAVDRAHFDAVHVLTFDTAFIDDEGQLDLLQQFTLPADHSVKSGHGDLR